MAEYTKQLILQKRVAGALAQLLQKSALDCPVGECGWDNCPRLEDEGDPDACMHTCYQECECWIAYANEKIANEVAMEAGNG